MTTIGEVFAPEHVAVIMDGNGRWAKKRGFPRTEGHRQGLMTARKLVQNCISKKIPQLTLFAFSQENFNRPPQEVNALLQIFSKAVSAWQQELKKNGVRLRFIGELERFPKALRLLMNSLQNQTKTGQNISLAVAVGYSGRWDILQAARRVADNFSEESFVAALATADMPPLDFLIRTGGEKRISNFMLWQAAYAELYFTDVLWPDFSDDDLQTALDSFAGRERRFGHLSR